MDVSFHKLANPDKLVISQQANRNEKLQWNKPMETSQ
jgi:hypothetical protein